MRELFHRLWHAVSNAPTQQRTAAQTALIHADLNDDTELLPAPVSDEEIRRALDWLLTVQHQRRHRQRRRRALSYPQRDQVASILLRLSHQLKRPIAMTAPNREKWIKETINELNKASAGTSAEGTNWASAIEQEANEQEDEYGDNSEQWDKPADVAQRYIDDHHEGEETP